MGSCSTQPSVKETLDHFKHENHRKDHKFISILSISLLSMALVS